MFDGYAKIHKDKSSRYSSRAQHTPTTTHPSRDHSRSGDYRKTKQNSNTNRWELHSKSQNSTIFKPDRNHSSIGNYSKHSRLKSDVINLKKTIQTQYQLEQPDRPLQSIYNRVQSVLQGYRKREQEWLKTKKNYEKKIALLVNQLARTERLR